jgi:hypothetical protein
VNRFQDRADVPPFVAPQPADVRGRRLVVGLLTLGVVAACGGIAWQRGQTRACLAFYGPEVARAITTAPRVELWSRVRPALQSADESGGAAPLRLLAAERIDVSDARGLVHLRRGLVEDANFRPAGPAVAEPLGGEWSYALVFSPSPVDRVGQGADGAVAVLFAEGAASVVNEGGDRRGKGGAGGPRWLCVVGRPGIMPVGRIGAGIRAWIESAVAARAAGGG